MAEGSEGDRPSRHPKNLQGLLKLCVEQTKEEDAPAPGRELSPERKAFLREALQGMVEDPIESVKAHMTRVGVFLGSQQPSDDARTQALESLEELFDWCESIDVARDFVKMGGISILHELLTHSDRDVRLEGFRLVGVLVQNHPQCQEAAVQADLLPTMLSVLRTEIDPQVQTQAVQAVSCLVRDSLVESTRQQFVTNKGFEVLKKVLQSGGLFKRVVKIAFFLGSLCQSHPQYKDVICEAGIVELLAQELKGEHEQSHEHVMSCLLFLAKDHTPTQRVLARPALDMSSFLHDHVQTLTDKPESEEERQYAQELLQIIRSASS